MRLWYRMWQYLTQVVFCSFFQLRVVGRENVPATGPVLLVSNHQSYLDPPLCGVSLTRELDYIARDSLFRNRLFGWFIHSLNAFAIHRAQENDSPSKNIEAIKTIIKRLQNGRAMTFFPEGTRTSSGLIQPIQSGLELIVRRSGATVIPVVIDGAFEVWPRHQLLPSMGPIRIIYGTPIPPDQSRLMKRDQLITEINTRLRAMQNNIRLRYGKVPYNYETTSKNRGCRA